jgi:hypothetical protein
VPRLQGLCPAESGHCARDGSPDTGRGVAPRVLRCLTVLQPYASAIAAGVKGPENRTWPAPPALIGTWVGIHAGKRLYPAPDLRRDDFTHPLPGDPAWPDCPPLADLPRGAIVGVARLVRSVRVTTYRDNRRALGLASDLWAVGPWCHVFESPIALPEPIPCRGMQGYWSPPWAIRVELEAFVARRGAA